MIRIRNSSCAAVIYILFFAALDEDERHFDIFFSILKLLIELAPNKWEFEGMEKSRVSNEIAATYEMLKWWTVHEMDF